MDESLLVGTNIDAVCYRVEDSSKQSSRNSDTLVDFAALMMRVSNATQVVRGDTINAKDFPYIASRGFASNPDEGTYSWYKNLERLRCLFNSRKIFFSHSTVSR